ncbi:hypothetical protein TNIN_245041 [Trichonephila inaurata madagascariensis]|uniref:Uncharacterized protein n=1 Tax=Trichonephila inaurata madagascariensis TaxID=2747483 RepID=A0A8X6Y2R8_9ARAC|nr:hypothetical protein TNIN_245041 [Trichonephila inaurata madagascariensis]
MDDEYNKQCSRTEKEMKVRQPIFLHRVQKNGGKKELRVQNQKKKVPLLKREDKGKKIPRKMEDVSSRGLQEKKLLRALSSEPVAVHGRKMFSAEKEIQSLDRKDTEKKLALGSSSFFGQGAQNATLLNFVLVLRGGGRLKL